MDWAYREDGTVPFEPTILTPAISKITGKTEGTNRSDDREAVDRPMLGDMPSSSSKRSRTISASA
jgi:hypothetical protein